MEPNIVQQCSDVWWTELSKKVKQAVVFIDDRIAECLHWNGGLVRLLRAGAKSVKSLSPFEKAPNNVKKAVFITSFYLLPEFAGAQSIKSIIENSALEYCIAVTIVSHTGHISVASRRFTFSDDGGSANRIFDTFESNLLDWMGNPNFTAEVFHIPLFIGCLADDCFLTLGFTHMTPKLDEASFHTNFDRIPDQEKADVQAFISCFNSLLAATDIREDIYCAGPYSSLIGTQLANFQAAKIRRKSASRSATLIFMDRNMDPVTPFYSHLNAALDYMLSVLPPFSHHECDRAIFEDDSDLPIITRLPCTLFGHDNDPETVQFTQLLIEKTFEDARELVRVKTRPFAEQYKVNILQAKSVDDDKKFETLWSMLKSNEKESHKSSGVIQLCVALAGSDRRKNGDTKFLLRDDWVQHVLPAIVQCLEEGQPLDELLSVAQSKRLTFEEQLVALIILYHRAGLPSWIWSTEDYVMMLTSEAMRRRSVIGGKSIASETAASQFVAKLFVKLKNIARLSDLLPAEIRGHSEVPYATDLLRRFLSTSNAAALQTSVPELPCKTSAGIGDALKSTLSLFTGPTPSKNANPADASIVILFFLGGVTCWELASIRKFLLQNRIRGKQIVIGATKLLTAENMLATLTS